jgi:hypothetical protein
MWLKNPEISNQHCLHAEVCARALEGQTVDPKCSLSPIAIAGVMASTPVSIAQAQGYLQMPFMHAIGAACTVTTFRNLRIE